MSVCIRQWVWYPWSGGLICVCVCCASLQHRRGRFGTGAVIGAQFVDPAFRDQAAFSGFAVMQALACFLPRAARFGVLSGRGDAEAYGKLDLRVLQLGLGAGTVPTWLRFSCGQRVDVVEYSADVVAAAVRYFGYDRRDAGLGQTVVEEARAFLFGRAAPFPYDVVVQDVFVGSNPLHMLTREVFARVRDEWLLRGGGGAYVVNMVGLAQGGHELDTHGNSVHDGSLLARAVACTLRAEFKVVRCFRDKPPDDAPDEPTNIACVATDDGGGVASWRLRAAVLNHPVLGDPGLDADEFVGNAYWVMRRFFDWEVLQPFTADSGAEGTGVPAACAGVPVLDDAMRQKPLPVALQRSVDTVAAAMRRWAADLVPENGWELAATTMMAGDEERSGDGNGGGGTQSGTGTTDEAIAAG